MILAAGQGTRLLPLTHSLPKPLFPVLNVPLLGRLVRQLDVAGFRLIVVNCFHLAPLVLEAARTWKTSAELVVIAEPVLLGTGGALWNARHRFHPGEPVLVINGDVVTDLDPCMVLRCHPRGRVLVTMVMHDRIPWNNVAVEGERVTGFACADRDALAFTGISVLEPEFFQYIPAGMPSSLVDALRRVLVAQHEIMALRADTIGDGYVWEDIGTPLGYLTAHQVLLGRTGHRCIVGSGSIFPGDLVQDDWVCIGRDVRLGAGVTLGRTVIWDGTCIPDRSVLHDRIVTPFGQVGLS